MPVGAERVGEAAGVRAGPLEQLAQALRGRATAAPPTPRRRARGARTRARTGRARAPRSRSGRPRPALASRRAAAPRRGRRRGRCRRARSATCGRRWPRSPRPPGPPRAARATARARAHRPKAPSTCTQAPGRARPLDDRAPPDRRRRCSRCRPAGRRWSRSSRLGSASARMRPWPSTGTRSTRSPPRPSSASAFSTLTCTSSPTTTRSGGAPKRPFASTFQPWRASSAWRAAARPLWFAVVAHVTKPTPVPAGRASTSSSQRDGGVLEGGGHRRGGPQAGVLVPRRGEDARRDRGRQRAADHEAEEARAGRAEGRRRSRLVEQRQHALGGEAGFGQRRCEARESGQGVLAWEPRAAPGSRTGSAPLGRRRRRSGQRRRSRASGPPEPGFYGG